MATLKDVAARAGVSVGAVSRVLGGDRSLVVRQETRDRVVAAAAALDYRPNRMASGLRTRRARSVALFLPDPQNLGWAEMLTAIGTTVAAADHLLAIADVRGPAVDPDVFSRYALEARVDGVLLATGLLPDALVARLASRGLPLLPVASRYASVDASVTMLDSLGSTLAVEHLTALGHRRIAFVSGLSSTDIVIRRDDGFRSAMAAAGLPAGEGWLVPSDGTFDDARRAARSLLARPIAERPSAILAVNLMSALGVRSALREAGLRVPPDVSLVTFDDHPVVDHLDPALTVIRMPMAQMGTIAAGMMLGAIDGAAMTHVVVPDLPQVVIRASTAAPLR